MCNFLVLSRWFCRSQKTLQHEYIAFTFNSRCRYSRKQAECWQFLANHTTKAKVPDFEISSFLSLFDTDGDQRISWEEFKDALGGKEDDPLDERLEKRLEDAADDERTDPDGRVPMKPEVSGTVKVQIDGNKEVEVDAAAYMEELAKEAQALTRAVYFSQVGCIEAKSRKKT